MTSSCEKNLYSKVIGAKSGKCPSKISSFQDQHVAEGNEDSREKMVSFWKEHSTKATEEEMMLDSNADILGKEEIPEILSMMPNISGLDILELGAGIGRFTGHFAKKAKTVTAIDFMENFVQSNRDTNQHFGNITFQQADVTRLEYDHEIYDLVFSNWLMMYLEEEEVKDLFINILTWLRPGGYFFFRESCFHQSGNASRQSNPTKYRKPSLYNNILQSALHETNDGIYAFEIIMSKSVQTYIKLKSNRNQLCWLVQKVKSSKQNSLELSSANHNHHVPHRLFHEYLTGTLSSVETIHSYEWMFGENFVSTGGIETAEEHAEKLKFRPNQQLLLIGSGIGGSAFHIAKTYDVKVVGIDPSANMVALALERANSFKDAKSLQVQFQSGEPTKATFANETFDSIYFGEVPINVKDKKSLFESFFRWLKPGGCAVIVDYCRGQEVCHWSESFGQHVEKYDYHLLSADQYTKTLEEVGFELVVTEDQTDQQTCQLKNELIHMERVKDDVTQELSHEDYFQLVEIWKNKIVWNESGDLKSYVFSVKK